MGGLIGGGGGGGGMCIRMAWLLHVVGRGLFMSSLYSLLMS